MDRIQPITLKGPRSYFTSFDPEIIARTSDVDSLKIEVERKLKLLLLVKSIVVCPASHLASDLAFSIFRDSPILLNQGLVIPALRSDKGSLEDVFQEARNRENKDAISLFKENVVKTVSWDLVDNSSWFRQRFLAELTDERSVIRRHLKETAKSCIENLVRQIEAEPLLIRESITDSTLGFEPKEREILLNFRELLYHMSGARVVNCESALPQENYIDFDLADMASNRTRLSEEQILWKLFVELAMDSVQHYAIPVELIDALSFAEIIEIRKPLLDAKFQDNYDRLLMQAVTGIPRDEAELVLSAAKLEEIRCNIALTFKSVFDKELPYFLKKRALRGVGSFRGVTASLALGAIGLIPVVGLAATIISMLKDSTALIVNVGNVYRTKKATTDVMAYNRYRKQYLSKTLSKNRLAENSQMLDMVSMLTDALSERMKM